MCPRGFFNWREKREQLPTILSYPFSHSPVSCMVAVGDRRGPGQCGAAGGRRALPVLLS